MKPHRQLVLFAALLFCLGACSGEPDNSLPADTPIKFSGGTATIHKFISDSAVSHESIDRINLNVMAIQFAYTLEPDATAGNLGDLVDKCFLVAKDGMSYKGISTVRINMVGKHIVTVVFGVPKNVLATSLKLKAGDSLIKLPKPE